jgi:formate/nitrite transporter FocA (FNT family)
MNERAAGRDADEDVLDVEPAEISERGVAVGEERLRRTSVDILVTGFIGGVEVSFGGLAGALVIGVVTGASRSATLYTGLAVAGLAFPAGFAFVIFGWSELFTENFLIPVVALVGRRLRPLGLVRLWALSWLGNMAGCAAIALLAHVPESLGDPIIRGYTDYAAYKLSAPPLGTFTAALLAGAVMTILTWLFARRTAHPA